MSFRWLRMEAQFAHVLNQWNDCRRGRVVQVVLLVLEELLRTPTALYDVNKIWRSDISQRKCIY